MDRGRVSASLIPKFLRRALIESGVAGEIEKLVEKLLDGAAGD